ncbi:MAG: hypothetical protein ACFE0P_08925 [Oceanicaulis sp.]
MADDLASLAAETGAKQERPRSAGRDLVVLGQARDPQIGAVLDRLCQRGVQAHILDYYAPDPFVLDFTRPGRPRIRIGDTELNSELLVWDRSKFFANTAYYFDDVAPGETEYETRRRHQLQEVEWRGAYQLLVTLPHVAFLNHPVQRNAMLKPVQQMVAQELGLATPPSVVTNEKGAVEAFLKAYPRAVLKSLSGGRFARPGEPATRTDMLMTMAVEAEQVDAAEPDAFIRAPHFFQQNIPKAYEVRLFAHRGAAYPFKVDSQAARFTSTDWRHGASVLDWSPCAAPPGVLDAVQAFLERFELFYGSFDFIVTPQEEWVFLECNRDGQWAWLDRMVDHALSNGLADAIAETWFQTA